MTITNVPKKAKSDAEEIQRAVTLICDGLTELRVFRNGRMVLAGYYDDYSALARDAAAQTDAEGLYIIPNKIDRDLLSRSINRLKPLKETTKDRDVISRRWLLIDFDPARKPGISSTNTEHEAAIARARDSFSWLTEQEIPRDSMILADSGNGAHLLIRVEDLPNNDQTRDMAVHFLRLLKALWEDEAVLVDQSTFNAARIWKLYGTTARKGDSTPDRPHRLSRILWAPPSMTTAPLAALRCVADMAPAETVAPKPKTTDLPEFDLDAKLREYALTVTRREPYQGGTRYILERCPFNADHGGTSSAIIRLASGAIVFKCQHNGCAERTWADVRRLRDPGVDNGAKYVNSNPSSIYCDCTAAESKRDKSVTDSVTAKPQKPLSERVEEWISGTTGWFSYEECDKELGIITPTDKDNRRQIFRRFKEGPNPKIESHPDNNKLFRKVNMAVRLIDFKSSLKRAPVALRFPFGIEQYFNTYPGNIIVVAGAADAGKTAFLLNVVRLNMYDFTIYYQSSEMGEQELASRLQNFPGLTLDEWNFTAEERSHDFADVIRPDCVNIIDYMELSSECYRVADYLRAIHDKLAGGVAIVALQKKRGADLGRGGDFGIEKPRLYLSMDKGSLTIQKAKNWVDPQKNPNGMAVNFKIVGGCQFTGIVDWYRTEAAK